MTKDEFKEKEAEKKKDFIKRFRERVDMDMLKELYEFFKTEDTISFTEDGLYVQPRIDGTEVGLKNLTLDMYPMIKFAQEYYVSAIRTIFNELIDAPKEPKKKKKVNTYK